jgi:serine/threonine protein kinase
MSESHPQPASADQQEPEDTLSVGTIFDGKYEIVGFVGQGGMARVYRARHTKTGQLLAVKVLNREEDEKLARVYERRFMREATIAASLMHPNVVPVHDFGIAEPSNQRFIAMDLLDGHDLAVELKTHGPMAPDRAIRLVSECLDALAVGHQRGIVHKDLKPANLFLTAAGTGGEALVILDFGVATIDAVQITRLTEMGTFAGTPQYLPPEYILDQTVLPALDVYQMGLILVEMLDGRAVLHGKNAYACIRVHCDGSLAIPPSLLDGPLGPVVRRATALDPKDRYREASAFKAALAEVDTAEVYRTFTPTEASSENDALTRPFSSLPTKVGPAPSSAPLDPASTATVAAPLRGLDPGETAPTVAVDRVADTSPMGRPGEREAEGTGDKLIVTLVLVAVLIVVTCLAAAAWVRSVPNPAETGASDVADVGTP